MSSSSRTRVLRGVAVTRAFSPLDAELPGPTLEIDRAAAAAEERRGRQALELTGLEDALARTAVDLAAAIVGRELAVSASPGADALARALALVPAGCVAVARLHPTDVATL